MPTYQYACTECGVQLEVVQKFTDEALTVCSACGGKLRKLFSAVGIVFKGSGFYRTDSRNGSGSGKKAETAAASGDSGGKSGDSGSKTDSAAKPADSGSAKKAESAGSSSSSSSSSSSGTKVA
ncbi:MAG: FmdB family zinc ribbon protein [Gemmatimonadota bacterium]